jgi:hypothetical protein
MEQHGGGIEIGNQVGVGTIVMLGLSISNVEDS